MFTGGGMPVRTPVKGVKPSSNLSLVPENEECLIDLLMLSSPSACSLYRYSIRLPIPI